MKRLTLLLLTILLLTLGANLVNAQTPEIDEKMAQMEALKEQMANATPEEYETLKSQYEALGAEIKALIGAMQADAESKSRAISEYNRGNQALRQRDYATAIAAFNTSAELNPLEAKTFYSLGLAYQFNNQLDQAEQAFTKATQLDATYVKAYYAKGMILNKKRQFGDAVAVFQRAVQVENGDPADRSKAFAGLGLAYYYQKDYSKAINAFSQATQLDATNDDAFYNMGKAYSENGQMREAADAIRSAVAIDGRSAKYLTALAEKLNKLGSFSEAAGAAEQATGINGNYAAAWFELGWARQHLEQKDAAIAAYEKAMNDRNYRQPAQYQIDILNGKF